jgi:CBS domain-containing protein
MPTTIKGLFENIPLEAMMIENWVRKRLVLVGDNQPLDKALQRLNRHKITSLPIINEQTGNIKGILDSLDIVNYLSTVLDQEAIGPARWDFNLKNTGQLLDMSKNRGSVMSNQSNVYEALKVLAKGEPRVMVIDASCNVHIQEREEENILGLFTQSDIVRFLGANPYWLKLFPDSCKRLSELGIVGNNNEQVITVEQNTPAYEAFKKIAEASTSGVAVVDGQGRIVAHLSASNIRGISRRNFQLLRRPLFEFLQRDRRRGWWTMPVCLNEGDTLEKAVLQFGSTRVHQMYVCDAEGKPKHVVNLTDIVRQFVSVDDQPRSA